MKSWRKKEAWGVLARIIEKKAIIEDVGNEIEIREDDDPEELKAWIKKIVAQVAELAINEGLFPDNKNKITDAIEFSKREWNEKAKAKMIMNVRKRIIESKKLYLAAEMERKIINSLINQEEQLQKLYCLELLGHDPTLIFADEHNYIFATGSKNCPIHTLNSVYDIEAYDKVIGKALGVSVAKSEASMLGVQLINDESFKKLSYLKEDTNLIEGVSFIETPVELRKTGNVLISSAAQSTQFTKENRIISDEYFSANLGWRAMIKFSYPKEKLI